MENLLVEKLAVLYLRLALMYKADLMTAPLIFTKVEAGVRGDESPVVTEPVGRESEIATVRDQHRAHPEPARTPAAHAPGQPVLPAVKVELSA